MPFPLTSTTETSCRGNSINFQPPFCETTVSTSLTLQCDFGSPSSLRNKAYYRLSSFLVRASHARWYPIILGIRACLLEHMYGVTPGSTLETCNTLKWLYKNISVKITVTVSPVLSTLAVTRRNQWRSKTHGLTLTGVTQHVRRISGEFYLGAASLWASILHGGAGQEIRNSVICH